MIPTRIHTWKNAALIALLALSAYLLFDKYYLTTSSGYCNLTCDNFEDVEPNIYSLSFVKNLVDNYSDKQLRYIRNGFSSEGISQPSDAQSVWFGIKELKNYIYNIEKKWETKCGDCSVPLGIRIYYGAYPNLSDPSMASASFVSDLANVPTAPHTYSNLHTLVMVPTYYSSGANVDFSTDHFDDHCSPTNIDDLICNDAGATARVGSSSAPPQIMALIGGAEDRKLKIKNNQDTNKAKRARPNPDDIDPPPTTAMNHGNLFPPPFENPKFNDAKFLNPCTSDDPPTTPIANPPQVSSQNPQIRNR